jgi:hypothetical protein
MNFNLLSITLNILTPTSDISSITISCNCSYQHVSLFNKYNDKFDKLDKDCSTGLFNAKCIVKPSILKAYLSMHHAKCDFNTKACSSKGEIFMN